MAGASRHRQALLNGNGVDRFVHGRSFSSPSGASEWDWSKSFRTSQEQVVPIYALLNGTGVDHFERRQSFSSPSGASEWDWSRSFLASQEQVVPIYALPNGTG